MKKLWVAKATVTVVRITASVTADGDKILMITNSGHKTFS